MYLYIIIQLFITIVLIFYIISSLNRRKWKNVPGPKPVVLFGNTLEFLFLPKTKFLPKVKKYIEEHGEIFVLHDAAFGQVIVVSNYELTEYVLKSTKFIEKSYEYEYLHPWLGTGLLTSGGTKWKTHRRLITPSFHFSILSNFVDVFESVGNAFISKLSGEVGKPSVDIYPLVSLCTLDIICEAAMGTSINAQMDGESEYVRSVKTVCDIVVDRIFSPIHKLLYPLTPNYYRERKALKIIHAHTEKVIDQKIRNLSNGVSKKADASEREQADDGDGRKKRLAFLDLLLQSNIDGEPLSRIELREEVDTFMFEGHDTTSSAIAFALYSLATNPDIQHKVVDEQRSIFGSNSDLSITILDLQKMNYLELVIKETLRLYPSVPSYARKVTEDFEWNGITFFKNSSIFLLPFFLHRNPKYFPEPEKFIPERFENGGVKDPFAHVPFSAGPRNCIGQKFALLEMKSTISKVVRHFELLPTTPEHVLELTPETILVSKNGVCISLRKR